MNNKNILLAAFLFTVLAQLFVPAKMIWDREEVIKSGIEHKFKTAPFDPNDPFRGKYINLRYSENSVEVKNETNWTNGERVYLSFAKDEDGFTTIQTATKEKPTDKHDYLKAKVLYVSANNTNRLTIEYPFDRFYMEESKAYDAEKAHMRAQIDTTTTTYALVNIKNGNAVLKDVLIDDISIREIVMANQN